MHESGICVVDSDLTARHTIADLASAMRMEFRSFATAEDLLGQLPMASHIVIVSEIRLLGMNGIELQKRLRQDPWRYQFVFHTAHAETQLTVEAMRNGAITVLERPASEQALWDALHEALAKASLDRHIMQQRSELQARLDKLSRRERRVLRLMLDGFPNKSIARQLEVSLRTVENSRHNIFRKMRSDSIAELVREIMEKGPAPEEL